MDKDADGGNAIRKEVLGILVESVEVVKNDVGW